MGWIHPLDPFTHNHLCIPYVALLSTKPVSKYPLPRACEKEKRGRESNAGNNIVGNYVLGSLLTLYNSKRRVSQIEKIY